MTGAPVQFGQGNADVIASGPDEPSRPPRTITVGLALVLVVAAAMTGYLVGSRHRGATATPGTPSSSAAAPVLSEPLDGTGERCSVELKDRLQLGIEIVNQSTATVTLRRAQAVLPLRGLRARGATWGGCGQLSPVATGDDHSLPGGATTWLTITFDVLVPCPKPIPVLFAVQYTQASRSGTAELPGFADLGNVPYTGGRCPDDSS
ncbi:hypothetical protein [Sphaerisporangium sp. TRM90804]|uniref:hypothetical protein n=1 Tax=Sphaerisporangium sp. TRM90804 TaxID=3031113 RepID=UPI00244C6076|nr:hypothetical protein [Sphaerisporangium sp. TRM90804]MDH2426920.1 hypothetical protein [Sphaerisporangium sp. TRM90804]